MDRSESEPGEVEPDLEIQEVLRGELAGDPFKVLPVDVQPSLHQEFMIAGKRTYHRRPIDREIMTNEEGLFFLAQVGRRPLGMFQKEVMDGSGADFLQLEE